MNFNHSDLLIIINNTPENLRDNVVYNKVLNSYCNDKDLRLTTDELKHLSSMLDDKFKKTNNHIIYRLKYVEIIT